MATATGLALLPGLCSAPPEHPRRMAIHGNPSIGKHNQGRPEPVAPELHAKNQTHFAFFTKKTKGKQSPPIQIYCTIDKEQTSNTI